MTVHPKGTAIARQLLDTPTGCMRSNAVVKVPLASLADFECKERVPLFDKVLGRPRPKT